MYLQHLILVKPFLLPAAIAAGSSNGFTDTVVCAPYDGWRYHPKHVEQFRDRNKLCYVASCWIYIGINYIKVTINEYRIQFPKIYYLLFSFPPKFHKQRQIILLIY